MILAATAVYGRHLCSSMNLKPARGPLATSAGSALSRRGRSDSALCHGELTQLGMTLHRRRSGLQVATVVPSRLTVRPTHPDTHPPGPGPLAPGPVVGVEPQPAHGTAAGSRHRSRSLEVDSGWPTPVNRGSAHAAGRYTALPVSCPEDRSARAASAFALLRPSGAVKSIFLRAYLLVADAASRTLHKP
jgi:hypothetical protein